MCTEVGCSLPTRGTEQPLIVFVSSISNCDPEFPSEMLRHPGSHCHIPAADENRSDGLDHWIETCSDPPFNSAEVCFRCCDILFCRKEECHVDRNSCEDRLFDRG